MGAATRWVRSQGSFALSIRDIKACLLAWCLLARASALFCRKNKRQIIAERSGG